MKAEEKQEKQEKQDNAEGCSPSSFILHPSALVASLVAASPLAANCQAYATANGLVTGVKLAITTVPGALYEVAKVELIPEAAAQGQTVAKCFVYDKAGLPTAIKVRLAWPGVGPVFEASALSVTGEHFISNGYDPRTGVGPLALCIGEHNAWTSDIVTGLGLPDKHHVSWVVVFREKGGVVVDPDTDARLQALVTWARAVSAKYKDGPQYV